MEGGADTKTKADNGKTAFEYAKDHAKLKGTKANRRFSDSQ
jgi:hypothetical protein